MEALAAKTAHLKEKLAKLESEMERLAAMEKQMLASPDQQISLTDPDSRSMATSGRGSGVVGYNVQVAVETEHHLIVTHEVTNSGSDRAQLANMGRQAREALGVDKLEAVADRGYYNSTEIKACDDAGVAVTLPKPMTSGAKSDGRFGKQDFVYNAAEDVWRSGLELRAARGFQVTQNDLWELQECLQTPRSQKKPISALEGARQPVGSSFGPLRNVFTQPRPRPDIGP